MGESPDNKFIETVPRKGYRFVVEVEPIFEKPAAKDIETSLPPAEITGENLTD